MLQFFKKIRSKNRYTKWKNSRPVVPPINYIGGDPNVSFEMKLVCFVNDEFPLETIMHGVADCVGSWFLKNSQSGLAVDWRRRKTNPVMYKVKNSDGMQIIQEMHLHMPIEISMFSGYPIAICLGPLWTNQLLMYNNNYEQLIF